MFYFVANLVFGKKSLNFVKQDGQNSLKAERILKENV